MSCRLTSRATTTPFGGCAPTVGLIKRMLLAPTAAPETKQPSLLKLTNQNLEDCEKYSTVVEQLKNVDTRQYKIGNLHVENSQTAFTMQNHVMLLNL